MQAVQKLIQNSLLIIRATLVMDANTITTVNTMNAIVLSTFKPNPVSIDFLSLR